MGTCGQAVQNFRYFGSQRSRLMLEKLSRWSCPKSLLNGLEVVVSRRWVAWVGMDITNAMMRGDQCEYLPDDILTKVDHVSMAVSLESRLPLLDQRLVKFAWHIQSVEKTNNGQGKMPPRKLLDRYLPKKLLARPKVEFGLSIHDWLKGGLQDWAKAFLDLVQTRDEGCSNTLSLQRIWQELVNEQYNHWHSILNILFFQAWYDSRAYS